MRMPPGAVKKIFLPAINVGFGCGVELLGTIRSASALGSLAFLPTSAGLQPRAPPHHCAKIRRASGSPTAEVPIYFLPLSRASGHSAHGEVSLIFCRFDGVNETLRGFWNHSLGGGVNGATGRPQRDHAIQNKRRPGPQGLRLSLRMSHD